MNKKLFSILVLLVVCLNGVKAQALYAPVTTTNYNWDAVAETSPSSLTTTGQIDGSNFIMHSMAYAALYSMSVGLPNSGLISSGTRTYQLQPYTQNNLVFLTTGQTDSIIFVTPSPFNALSVIGFATEGTGSMNVTIRFTDNTTQVFNNISVADWFTGGTSVLSNFGRTNRTTGVISNPSGAPNIYPFDFNLTCGNRIKNVSNIKFTNTGTNPRLCLMGVSGASNSSAITLTSNPVTCAGGTNGSASVSATGGTPPFTYSWVTTPVINSSFAGNLGPGTYTCIVTDAGGCSTSNTISITQSLVTQPPLLMSSNTTSVCLGTTVAIGASGANTYTWSTGSNQQIITDIPLGTTIYTVGGFTSANCYRTGSISISVYPVPVANIGAVPPSFCINSPSFALTGSPSGGNLSGNGLVVGGFDPALAGLGTATFSYIYADPASGCSDTAYASTVINPLPSVTFSLSNVSFCNTTPAFSLSGSGLPAGGLFSGNGVSGNSFYPGLSGVGGSILTYSFTDVNNCVNSATTAVSVSSLAAPSTSISKTLFCPKALPVIIFGTPSTGTFSGNGANPGGLFTPTLAGTGVHTITYSISSGPCTATTAISLTVSICESVRDNEMIDVKIFPNPSNQTFNISSAVELQLEMYNKTGQIVLKQEIKPLISNPIETSHLSAGIYILKISSGEGTFVKKIIVEH